MNSLVEAPTGHVAMKAVFAPAQVPLKTTDLPFGLIRQVIANQWTGYGRRPKIGRYWRA